MKNENQELKETINIERELKLLSQQIMGILKMDSRTISKAMNGKLMVSTPLEMVDSDPYVEKIVNDFTKNNPNIFVYHVLEYDMIVGSEFKHCVDLLYVELDTDSIEELSEYRKYLITYAMEGYVDVYSWSNNPRLIDMGGIKIKKNFNTYVRIDVPLIDLTKLFDFTFFKM